MPDHATIPRILYLLLFRWRVKEGCLLGEGGNPTCKAFVTLQPSFLLGAGVVGLNKRQNPDLPNFFNHTLIYRPILLFNLI